LLMSDEAVDKSEAESAVINFCAVSFGANILLQEQRMSMKKRKGRVFFIQQVFVPYKIEHVE